MSDVLVSTAAVDEAERFSGSFRYDAAISYSRTDVTAAVRIQSGLHRFARPLTRRRALHVFRDDAALATTPGLWSSIRAALDHSRYLIVLASPHAATSTWVDREIRHWLATRAVDTILPVILEGTWDEAMPPALAAAYAEEPRYVDLRGLDVGVWDLRGAEFRSAIADLAAPIHGRPKEELESEDLRFERKARKTQRFAVTALCVFALATVVGAAIAKVNADRAAHAQADAQSSRRTAEQEQARARQARTEADAASRETEKQLARAAVARREASRQEALAGQQRRLAQEFQGKARTALAESRRQQAIAARQQGLAGRAAVEAARQQQAAAKSRAEAIRFEEAAQRARGDAAPQSRIAVSRRLAQQAGDIAATNPALGKRLAVAAWRVEPTVEARGAVLGTQMNPHVRTLWPPHDPNGLMPQVASGTAVLTRTAAVTADGDGLFVWNPATGEREKLPTSGVYMDGAVRSIAVTPDGRHFAVTEFDGVSVWDLTTKRRIAKVGPRSIGVGIDPEARWVTAQNFSTGAFELWDVRTGRLLRRIPPSVYEPLGLTVMTIHLAPSGLVIGQDFRGGPVHIWNLAAGATSRALSLAGQTGYLDSVAISPDGHYLAGVPSGNGQVEAGVWDLRSGRRVGISMAVGPGVNDLEFSHDGGQLGVVNGDGKVTVRAVRSGVLLATLENPQHHAHLAYGLDAERVLLYAPGDEYVIWDLSRIRRISGLPDDDAQNLIDDMAFTGRDHRLMVGSPEGDVQFRALPGGSLLRTHPGGTPGYPSGEQSYADLGLAASGDGRVVVSGKTVLRAYDGRTGAPLDMPAVGSDRLDALSVTWDGTRAAMVQSLSRVSVFDISAAGGGRHVRRVSLPGHVVDVAFSPDGATIAVADNHGLSFLDARSLRPTGRSFPLTAGAFLVRYRPDGRIFVLGGDGEGALLEGRTGRRLWSFGFGVARQHAEFLADGVTLATLNGQSQLELWDSISGRRIGAAIRIPGEEGATSLAAGKVSNRVAVGYASGAVQLWDADVARVAGAICTTYGGGLSNDDWRRLIPEMPYRDTCR
jgi:WD40 repeat protein